MFTNWCVLVGQLLAFSLGSAAFMSVIAICLALALDKTAVGRKPDG